MAGSSELTLVKEDAAPKFLAHYRNNGNVRAACKVAGISRQTFYDWKKYDAAFAAAFEIAREESIDVLEAIARKRAQESSDTLVIFLLKSLRPEVYRERYIVDMVQRFDRMTADELDDYIAKRLGEGPAGGEDSPGDAAIDSGSASKPEFGAISG